ncbi:MAG: hypothetical protein ACFFGZ_15410 [Candidatus Thorarchaeota archaeon]
MEMEIPHLELPIAQPEMQCQCGWQGDRKDAEREHQVIADGEGWISIHSFYFCPDCANPLDLKVKIVPKSALR